MKQKKILFILFVLSVFTTISVMVWLYIDAGDVGEIETKEIKKSFTQKLETKSIQWLNNFSNQDTNYSFPATEIEIQLDDLSNTYKQKVYNFDFKKLNEYNFFCIKQILDSKNVVTNKTNVINDIFEEFKQYKIKYEVKEFKK